MNCSQTRQIIDQVCNREIPENALAEISGHIGNCEKCREYLEDNIAICRMIQSCTCHLSDDTEGENLSDELLGAMDEALGKIDLDEIKPTIMESIAGYAYTRHIIAGVCTLVVLLLGAFTIYHYSVSNNATMGDEKYEASMERLPDGAILVKLPDGREIIYIEPALEAQGKSDDVLKELEKTLNNSESKADSFTFAVSD